MVPPDSVLLMAIIVSILPSFKYQITDSLSSSGVVVAAQVDVRVPPSNIAIFSLGYSVKDAWPIYMKNQITI